MCVWNFVTGTHMFVHTAVACEKEDKIIRIVLMKCKEFPFFPRS